MLTMTESIIEVGYFHTASSLSNSLRIGLHELLYGNKDSNSAHLSSESTFHGLIAHFEKILYAIQPNFEPPGSNPDPSMLITFIIKCMQIFI